MHFQRGPLILNQTSGHKELAFSAIYKALFSGDAQESRMHFTLPKHNGNSLIVSLPYQYLNAYTC